MEKAIVIANAAAGRGRNRRQLDLVRRACAEHGAEVIETGSAAESRARATESARSGCERVISAGGDGTAHHVLNGVCGTGAAFGVIPLGSGNDIARDAGLPLGVAAAARVALTGRRRPIDLGVITTPGGAPPRVFASVASFGLGALANRLANQARVHNKVVYIYAVLRALLEYRLTRVCVSSDGGDFEGEIMLGAVANGGSLGGGMRIGARAVMDDRLLDVCLVARMSRLKLLTCFPEVYFGKHLRHREVSYARVTRVSITSARPLDIFADGEFITQTPVTIEIRPAAISIIVP